MRKPMFNCWYDVTLGEMYATLECKDWNRMKKWNGSRNGNETHYNRSRNGNGSRNGNESRNGMGIGGISNGNESKE